MLKNFSKKSLLTLYISVVRPCFILAQNMSENLDADVYSVAYVTVPNTEVGKTIGTGLVEKKLAACVNVIPQITSIYEWEGKMTEDSEALLMIKTRTTQVTNLTDYVRSNHPNKICEVISLPIQNGNPAYLQWIGETVPDIEKVYVTNTVAVSESEKEPASDTVPESESVADSDTAPVSDTVTTTETEPVTDTVPVTPASETVPGDEKKAEGNKKPEGHCKGSTCPN